MTGYHPFILVVGPTGSGKSSLALALAEKFSAAILNCDSVQVYQRLNIGAAKPTASEMQQVPHLLFDVLAPGEVLTAADFRARALVELQRELPARPVFGVGGSGFYIQALEKGMFDVPKPNPQIEESLELECQELGLPAMHQRLRDLDPEYAEKVSPGDAYRVLRALVIIRETGKKVSQLRRDFTPLPFPFPLLKLGFSPPRDELLPRIQQRTRQMLEQGLIEEVRSLVDDGYGQWPAMQSVGYREALLYLRGEIDASQLQELIVEKTMQLAKKQKTWFRRDAEIRWLPMADPAQKAEEIVSEFVSQLLDSSR